jgi:hypothetical protein
MLARIVIQIAVLLWALSSVDADVFYTDKSHPAASDANLCWSPDAPCLTINGGIAKTSSSDELRIGAGVYDEIITGSAFNGRNGTSSARTKLTGMTAARWILRPTSCPGNHVVFLQDDSWIEFRRFIIDANGLCGVGLRFDGNSSDNLLRDGEVFNWAGSGSSSQGIAGDSGTPLSHRNRIDNVWVHAVTPTPPGDNTSHAIYVTGDDWIIENSTIEGAFGHGIHDTSNLGQTNNRTIIRDNTIRNNGSWGIGIYGGVDKQVYRNKIIGNGGRLIDTGGIGMGALSAASEAVDRALVYSNTLYNNTGRCIWNKHASTDNAEIINNLCLLNSNNIITNSGTGTVQATNILSSNASDIANAAAGDFTPVAASLINQGTIVSLLPFSANLPEIGAIEIPVTYWMSPSGGAATCALASGANDPGQYRTPAQARLCASRGDTIIAKKGTYNASGSVLLLRSADGVKSGTANAPIRLTAENPSTCVSVATCVVFQGNGLAGNVLELRDIAWWVVDNIIVRNANNAAYTGSGASNLTVEGAARNIILRQLIVADVNTFGNNQPLRIGGVSSAVSDILVEDVDVLRSHRNHVSAFESGTSNVTFRRVYASQSVASNCSPTCGPPDGFVFYDGNNSRIENSIAEGLSGFGFTGWGNGNAVEASVSLENQSGFFGGAASSGSGQGNNFSFKDIVGISPVGGTCLFLRSAHATASGVTCLTGSIVADNEFISTGSANVIIENAIATDRPSNSGFFLDNRGAIGWDTKILKFSQEWNTQGANGGWTLSNVPPNPPGDVNPNMGACRVWVPTTGPFKAKGENGADVGAEILYAIIDGVKTTLPLWDVLTGKMKYGPNVVSGVNDSSTGRVRDTVGSRLNITSAGCLPTGYAITATATQTLSDATVASAATVGISGLVNKSLGGASVSASGGVPTSTSLPNTMGWYQIPNTKLRAVCPPPAQYPSIQGIEGCDAVTKDWNSAVLDKANNRIIIWGGGHNGYHGNEVYSFDIDGLIVQRLNNPSVPIQLCSASYPDGTPSARHTQDQIVYIGHAHVLFNKGGAFSCDQGGINQDAWALDLTTLQWTQKSIVPNIGGNTWVMDYDPLSRLVYAAADDNTFRSYNYDGIDGGTADTWTTLRTNAFASGFGANFRRTGVIDPVRRKFFMIGNGTMHAYSLVGPAYTAENLTTQVTGATAIINEFGPGVAYDPKSGDLVLWKGGDSVYRYNDDTKTFTLYTYAGGPVATPNGVYKRFTYSQSRDVFITCNDIDDDCFALRIHPVGVATGTLATLAAGMRANEWSQLTGVAPDISAPNSANPLHQVGASGGGAGNTVNYAWNFGFDPVKQVIHYIGNDHVDSIVALGQRYVRFALSNNTWSEVVGPHAPGVPSNCTAPGPGNPEYPPFACPTGGVTDHGYGSHTVIPAGDFGHACTILYRKPSKGARSMSRFDTCTNQWLSNTANDPNILGGGGGGCCGSIEYVPGRGIIHTVGAENKLELWNPATDSWSTVASGLTGLTNGNTFTFATPYNPKCKCLIFGSRNASGPGGVGSAMYRYDAVTNTVTQISATPAALSTYSGVGTPIVPTADHVSGLFILVSADTRDLWTYDWATDQYQQITNSINKPSWANTMIIGGYLPTHGVHLYVECGPQVAACSMWAYKHVNGGGVFDSNARAQAIGVVRYFGFESPADLGTESSVTNFGYFANGGPCGSSASFSCPSFDTTKAASGIGSIKFVVPSQSVADCCGAWYTNFSADLLTQFGGGQEFFVQFRYKPSIEFINQYFQPNGKGKIFSVGTGDLGANSADSCTAQEIVLDHYLGHQQNPPPVNLYHNCGWYEGMTPPFDNPNIPGAGSDDIRLQNARPNPFCTYEQRGVGFFGQLNGGRIAYFPPFGNCFPLVPEWMTVQIGVALGPQEVAANCVAPNNQPLGVACYKASITRLWMARENVPQEPVVNYTRDLNATNEIPGNNKYGKLWLLPYMTGKTASQITIPAEVRYDDVLISTRFIENAYSGGATGTSGGGGGVGTVSQTRFPSGDSSINNNWTAVGVGASSKWDAVDDQTPNDDADYIQRSDSFANQQFTFQPFNISAVSISKVKVHARFRNGGGSGHNFTVGLWMGSGVNVYFGAPQSVTSCSAYCDHTSEFILNPVTNLPWIEADVEGTGPNPILEIIARATSMTTGDQVRVTRLAIEVEYVDAGGTGGISGVVNKTLGGLTGTGAATVAISGGVNAALGAATASATAITGITGTLGATLGDATVSATGIAPTPVKDPGHWANSALRRNGLRTIGGNRNLPR